MADGHRRLPRENYELKIDLMKRLVHKSCMLNENPVSRKTIPNWFSVFEQDEAEVILNELLNDPNSCVESKEFENEQIGLTDLDGARDFIEDLEQNPPQFENT